MAHRRGGHGLSRAFVHDARAAARRPREAISVQFDYQIGPDGVLRQIQLDDNDRRAHLWAEDLRWVGFMFDDFAAG